MTTPKGYGQEQPNEAFHGIAYAPGELHVKRIMGRPQVGPNAIDLGKEQSETMKIEELISGKNDTAEIYLEGMAIPVKSMKKLLDDGYVYIQAHKENGTVTIWGKTCTACLNPEQIRARG